LASRSFHLCGDEQAASPAACLTAGRRQAGQPGNVGRRGTRVTRDCRNELSFGTSWFILDLITGTFFVDAYAGNWNFFDDIDASFSE
jgi:hypothetical protein